MADYIMFDTVKVRRESGLETTFTPDEFLTIGLSERMRLILEQKVAFYLGLQSVPTREALRHIRERAAARAA